MSLIKNLCLLFTAIFVFFLANILIYGFDMIKSYEIKDENCKILDGPRGFEDQTVWNSKVVFST